MSVCLPVCACVCFACKFVRVRRSSFCIWRRCKVKQVYPALFLCLSVCLCVRVCDLRVSLSGSGGALYAYGDGAKVEAGIPCYCLPDCVCVCVCVRVIHKHACIQRRLQAMWKNIHMYMHMHIHMYMHMHMHYS
jgi:hypothetical protein